MELSGKQKAAMLLMSLDPASAATLLKGVDASLIEELAMELASMEGSGLFSSKEQTKIVKEFCESLGQSQGVTISRFMNEMLVNIVGEDKAEQIRSQIKKATAQKDMFGEIRSASVDEIFLALEGEHPLTIAVVLSELHPKKSQEILSLLNDKIKSEVVWKMANPDVVNFGVKHRIATMISERLKGCKGEVLTSKPGKREENLRKLALVLSGLEKDLRDQLFEEIHKQDEGTASIVKRLMITWEDIPAIADRSLQESLRNVDSSVLAVALFGADEEIATKIRTNMSERAAAMLDEEMSLMQEPMEKEVIDAREAVVKPLREANEDGKLRVTGR